MLGKGGPSIATYREHEDYLSDDIAHHKKHLARCRCSLCFPRLQEILEASAISNGHYASEVSADIGGSKDHRRSLLLKVLRRSTQHLEATESMEGRPKEK